MYLMGRRLFEFEEFGGWVEDPERSRRGVGVWVQFQEVDASGDLGDGA